MIDEDTITIPLPEAWRDKFKSGEPIKIELDLDDDSGFKQDYYRVKMPLKEVKASDD